MIEPQFCISGATFPYHNWACSELWSLSWLSSLISESALWWSPTMPENSEGSKVPFFTCTSSFSLATAPCCPPFTRFHFIRLFWNHTFTWRVKKTKKQQLWTYAPDSLNFRSEDWVCCVIWFADGFSFWHATVWSIYTTAMTHQPQVS